MNREGLVKAMSRGNKLGVGVNETVLQSFIEEVSRELGDGGKVKVKGFGNFEVTRRNSCTGFNPKTREKIATKASVIPKFKPSPLLKASLAEDGVV